MAVHASTTRRPSTPAKKSDKVDKKKKDLKRSKKRAKSLKAFDNQERIPRELSRLIAAANGVKLPSGLDEGEKLQPGQQKSKSKVIKEAADATARSTTTATLSETLKIQRGERLADYSARVDAALPVSGLVRKGNVKIDGVRPYQSKLERRLQKMQNEWRREDVRIKEQRQEQAEELQDALDEALPGVSARQAILSQKAWKDDDPWAELAKARKQKEKSSSGLVGVHDVVKAPPSLKAQTARLKTAGVFPRKR